MGLNVIMYFEILYKMSSSTAVSGEVTKMIPEIFNAQDDGNWYDQGNCFPCVYSLNITSH